VICAIFGPTPAYMHESQHQVDWLLTVLNTAQRSVKNPNAIWLHNAHCTCVCCNDSAPVRAAMTGQVITELRTLHGASHQNIVKYQQAFFDNGAIIIVMEYCDGGSLLDVLRAMARTRPGQGMPEHFIAELARQVRARAKCVKAWACVAPCSVWGCAIHTPKAHALRACVSVRMWYGCMFVPTSAHLYALCRARRGAKACMYATMLEPLSCG